MRASSLLRTVRGSGLAGLPSSFLQKAGRGNGCSCGMKSRPLSSIVETLSDYERDQPSDAGTMMKKEASLHHALGQLAGDFDRESNLSLCRFFRTRYAPAISTGSLMLDLALGIGGLPKGRIVEIYGREASGKTTLALHVVKEAQKLGGYCAYLDVENALDSLYAEQMGVKTEDLLIAHPNSAESSLGIVNTLINSGSLDVIVVDSVAALVPQCEIDGVININSKDVQSRLITQALHKIHYSLSRSQTLVIFVNHVRTNLRSSGGLGQENVVACGGKAILTPSPSRKSGKAEYSSQADILGAQVTTASPSHTSSPESKLQLKKLSGEFYIGMNLQKILYSGKDEVGNLSGRKMSSCTSPGIPSRSSSRFSLLDEFDDSEFACPFADDEELRGSCRVEISDADSHAGSTSGELIPVRRSPDAAVGALVRMLKTAAPLRQDFTNSAISSQANNKEAWRMKGTQEDKHKEAEVAEFEKTAPSSMSTAPRLSKSRTTADALEELRCYRKIKELILSKHGSQQLDIGEPRKAVPGASEGG